MNKKSHKLMQGRTDKGPVNSPPVVVKMNVSKGLEFL